MMRSTKGASKQRRDCINVEINEIKQCLPLSDGVKRRLSQLQIMAICKSYIQKTNCFQNAVLFEETEELNILKSVDFTDALPGFLMVITLDGRVLYISENVTEYVGHSMVELLTQAETIYDFIDSEDHNKISSFLLTAKSRNVASTDCDIIDLLCGINLQVLFRRNNVYDKQKRMRVHGKVVWPEGELNLVEPICVMKFTTKVSGTPMEQALVNDTSVFHTRHTLDMKYVHIDKNGEFYIGRTNQDLSRTSWYNMILPDFVDEAMRKHAELISSPNESAKSIVMQVQTGYGTFIWVQVVMRLVHNSLNLLNGENGCINPQEIVCLNQVMSEKEALDTIYLEQLDQLKVDEPCVPVEVMDPVMYSPSIPVVVVEEDTAHANMMERKPQEDTLSHQELLLRLKVKAQENNRNKRLKTEFTPYETVFGNATFVTKNEHIKNTGSLGHTTIENRGPLTPAYSDDGMTDGTVYCVPTPPDHNQLSCTPPYSPPNSFPFLEEVSIASRLDEETLFEGHTNPPKVELKPQQRFFDERSSLLDDLPVLDCGFVESCLQDMEYHDVLRLSNCVLENFDPFAQHMVGAINSSPRGVEVPCGPEYGSMDAGVSVNMKGNPLMEDMMDYAQSFVYCV